MSTEPTAKLDRAKRRARQVSRNVVCERRASMKSSRKAFLLIITSFLFFSVQNSFSSEPDNIIPKVSDSDSNPEISYYAKAQETIRNNWIYRSESKDETQDLFAVVVIKIFSDGKISDFRFDKESGNALFDSSVEKAIQRSNPLSPFQEGINKEFLELSFRFTPDPL
jgi:outer membrane biosynthesis protein TonB